MKDVFLKIMKNTEYPAKTRDELATEIADIVKAFVEWKMGLGLCSLYDFKKDKILTTDEHFNYWYNEIYMKK